MYSQANIKIDKHKEKDMSHTHESRTHSANMHLTPRGKKVLAGLFATLAIGGFVGVEVGTGAAKPHHSYTEEQLKDMPQQALTVKKGTGPDKYISQVDPTLGGSDTQGFEDVEQYILEQGLAHDVHGKPELYDGQEILVPVIPGKQGK